MKIGVLGWGSIGKRHTKNLADLGHEVKTYDPAYDKPELREQILDWCEAVVIASPNKQHVHDMKDAVLCQKHMFIEKPIGTDPRSVEALLGHARAKNTTVMTGYMLRFHYCVILCKEFIRSGELGEPTDAFFVCKSYMPDWRPGVDYKTRYSSDPVHGGCIYDISHEIDLSLHLLGPAVVNECRAGNSGKLGIQCEDWAVATYKHSNGCTTMIDMDYLSKPEVRNFRIVGTKGKIECDLLKRSATFFVGNERRYSDFSDDTFDENYVTEMSVFVAMCQGVHNIHAATGNDGLETLKIAYRMRELAGLPHD